MLLFTACQKEETIDQLSKFDLHSQVDEFGLPIIDGLSNEEYLAWANRVDLDVLSYEESIELQNEKQYKSVICDRLEAGSDLACCQNHLTACDLYRANFILGSWNDDNSATGVDSLEFVAHNFDVLGNRISEIWPSFDFFSQSDIDKMHCEIFYDCYNCTDLGSC